MSDDSKNIDWSKTTFEGAERESLRAWKQLSLEEKLKANEEMNEMFDAVILRKRESGEPYIDPDTGNLVRKSFAPQKEGTTNKTISSKSAERSTTPPLDPNDR